MLLLIDNYDSFTYNLYQYLSELGEDVLVIRNDKTTIEEIINHFFLPNNLRISGNDTSLFFMFITLNYYKMEF